ncbi:hypothetical protein KKF64_02755 [Patescibacteria group bacterium]|nr:hypothetical protein [Patescibacteria group bacterium]
MKISTRQKLSIFSLIIPYWLFKVAFALIDTPLVYGLVWWLRKDKRE